MSVWDLNSPLSPSRIQGGLLVAAYGLSLVAIMAAVMPLWAKVVLCLALAVSSVLAWQRWRMPAGQGVRELSWIGEQPSLVLANGQRVRVVWRQSTVWRWAVVLQYRAVDVDWGGELVLLPDSLPPEVFRRLKVRLLMEAA